ncbi:hypothetical protein HETIRDRAFT_311079 [Heterobasidion irregulare TC 32-1]|uniref:Uncharacterized protein n=1 Tax=Heterobasidion irregulare (strain TC 32-1) TaxID=747525 RepID=W4KGY9_HETIT|nr:uncharacterized protein HETIRDRAFT_311079 [Heterobasidion irregulare TC 32-1]ETW85128.1 hypothetical protein HETIRDRAFT_311079 [Heterobasidion irregulare TC 32-1]
MVGHIGHRFDPRIPTSACVNMYLSDAKKENAIESSIVIFFSDIILTRAGRQCQLKTLSKRHHLCKRFDTDAARFEEYKMWCSISVFAPHSACCDPRASCVRFRAMFRMYGVESPYK